ncbi:MAG TPA: BON domain-containing protein [Pyrinomonadaceae bacterium]|jgi:osmotically-inducible protein OsmY
MNKYISVRLLIFAAALVLSGCGAAAERAGGDGKAAAAPPVANAATPTPAAVAVAASADTAPAPPTTAGAATAQQGASPASAPRGSGSAQTAKMPTPRIGSGGNDFFLFTQARSAVNSDPELKAANLIIEVKEGVVTLNGTVAGAALKAKAEELARGSGPKAVRNQLRVSTGK